MSEFYDMKDAVTEITAALKPLQSLADSLRGLDKAHRLQADLQLLELCDSGHERQETFAKLDAAFNADTEAQATMVLCRKRGSDQRTFEQYAQAHGEANAKRAFTTEEDLQKSWTRRSMRLRYYAPRTRCISAYSPNLERANRSIQGRFDRP